MKRVLLLAIGVLLSASIAFAQTEVIPSDNGVGAEVGRHTIVHKRNLPLWIATFGRKGREKIQPAPGWRAPHFVHPVHVVARHSDGAIFSDQWTHNLRTTGGADWQASAMANTSAQPASCNYVAVTNDATAPAAGDCAAGSSACTLTSEISTNGLARAQGTYAHSNGTASYTVAKTFSASGTQASQKSGLFNASSSGTMCFEATYSAVTVNSGDTLTITWTVTY
jgi:hypothetical protein